MTNKIKQARQARDMTQAELAKAIGVQPASISRYENSDDRVTISLLRKMAEKLKVPASELISEADIDFGTDRPGQIIVPEIDAYFSAGAGGASHERIVDHWKFDRDYLVEMGGTPESARVVKVIGDSMEPRIRSGERIMIDTSDTDVSGRGGVYAIADGDDLLIKRVAKLPGSESLRITSDNPAYQPYDVAADRIKIYGRVFMALSRF